MVAFAQLAQIYFIDKEVTYSLRDYMTENCQNLVGLVNRMKDRCFSDWEEICTTLDLNSHLPKPAPEETKEKEGGKDEKEGDKEKEPEDKDIEKEKVGFIYLFCLINLKKQKILGGRKGKRQNQRKRNGRKQGERYKMNKLIIFLLFHCRGVLPNRLLF